MTFDPVGPFTFTSITLGGVSGRVSSMVVEHDGDAFFVSTSATSAKVPVTGQHARELVHVLKSLDFSSVSRESVQGYDVSVWSARLTQGSSDWAFQIRSDRVSSSVVAPLQKVLSDIAVGLKSR